jgi:hypothetical protein
MAHDENGCTSSDTIRLILYKPLQVYIGDDIIAQKGDTILTTKNNFREYLWNNLSKEKTITVNTTSMNEGDYFFNVIGTDSNNCDSNYEIMLSINKSTIKNNNELTLATFSDPVIDKLIFTINNIDSSRDLGNSLTTQL